MPFDLGRGSLSNESVAFQNKKLFDELVAIVKKAREGNYLEHVGEITTGLSDAIKRYVNMSTVIGISEDQFACAIPPLLSRNHALTARFSTNEVADGAVGFNLLEKAKKNIVGVVNNKEGRLYGDFTDIPVIMAFHTSLFKKGSILTPEEVAAIMLHEVGHGYTYFELLSRVVTTNLVLAAISKELDKSDSVEDREIILKAVMKSQDLEGIDPTELSKAKSRRVVDTVVITAMKRKYEAELGYDVYDITACEQAADNFATRYGAGVHLVTGLDKIIKLSGDISYRSGFSYFIIEAVKVAGVILGPVTAVLSGFGVPIFILALLMINADSRDSEPGNHYDSPVRRFERIRAQMVERLKALDLKKEESAAILENIKCVDEILKNMSDRRQFFGVIADMLTTGSRKNRDAKTKQYELERLASNDLFLSAAKFKAFNF